MKKLEKAALTAQQIEKIAGRVEPNFLSGGWDESYLTLNTEEAVAELKKQIRLKRKELTVIEDIDEVCHGMYLTVFTSNEFTTKLLFVGFENAGMKLVCSSGYIRTILLDDIVLLAKHRKTQDELLENL